MLAPGGPGDAKENRSGADAKAGLDHVALAAQVALLREKAIIKKLEATVDFLKAEVASEVKQKDETVGTLHKVECAYNQLQSDFDAAVERMTGEKEEALASQRAQHSVEMEGLTEQVRDRGGRGVECWGARQLCPSSRSVLRRCDFCSLTRAHVYLCSWSAH